MQLVYFKLYIFLFIRVKQVFYLYNIREKSIFQIYVIRLRIFLMFYTIIQKLKVDIYWDFVGYQIRFLSISCYSYNFLLDKGTILISIIK